MKRALAPITFCILALTGCRNDIRTSGKNAGEPVKVQTETISLTSISTTRTYIGKVTSATDILIRSPFPATLTDIYVVQGGIVRATDTLARLHSESIEGAYTSAKATYDQAKDASDRLHKVEWTESVPKVKIVEVDSQLSRAEATLRTAQKAKDDCIVKAPLDGSISEILVKEGEDISPAQPIFHIVDLNSLQITISVPEGEVPLYNIGDKVQVSIPSQGSRTFGGTLSKKSITAQAVSHSYECTVDIDNMPKGTMPGMMGKVTFVSGEITEGIVIPATAIYTGNDGRYVWIVGADGKVEKRNIEVGGYTGKGIMVTSGLVIGDKLIVKGMNKVSTGMKVTTE